MRASSSSARPIEICESSGIGMLVFENGFLPLLANSLGHLWWTFVGQFAPAPKRVDASGHQETQVEHFSGYQGL
jgi:hypothetical protein